MMKRCSLWIGLALLLCIAITVVFATPFSLAYISVNSNTLHNSFRVEYLPPQDISVPVRVQKTMLNMSERELGPGSFGFYLFNAETDEVVTFATSAEDGSAVMYLQFTADDVGKTYGYRLYELNDGREYVAYDKTVYDIGVTIHMNEMHELSVNGAPVTEIAAQFVNKCYVPVPVPDTGDHDSPMLWLSLLLLSGAALAVMKNKGPICRR